MELAISSKHTYRHAVIIGTLFVLLLLLFLFSLSIGAVPISVNEIIRIFLSRIGIGGINESGIQSLVLLNIRLPRLLFTTLIGAALGISGASMQGLFRNPLVEPGIVGVSSGAALGAISVILGLGSLSSSVIMGIGQWLLPAFAFVGGLMATAVTLRLGSHEGKTQTTILILAGVAISSLAGAAIGLAIFYADEHQLRTFTFWTLGDLSVATWQKVFMLAPFSLIAIAGLSFLGKPLNALALGEAEAFHSGVHVERLKIIIVLLCSLAVSTSVAFAGIIGFVGLVVPHIIRISFSPDHQLLLPASAIGGAVLLMLSDMLGRTVVVPAELPIGIITAAIGTPFFLYLLITTKRKRML
ncbi:MAG: iron ABC transporter permease [Cyclobacteriaceae bacterium]|nr:iron ABC transporter permease [Cyclobacteriaceae bacterium]